MADQNVRGRFVWHELETPESERAQEFYTEVLGWRTQAFEQDPSYSMFAGETGPLGGSVALRDERPLWLPYIETDDIGATIDEAKRLGASVLQDVTEIPNGSKYAILADPQGVRFAVHAGGGEAPERGAPERGEFSWHELATEDLRAAFDFYSRLFGWERVSEYDMGQSGSYLIFGRNGESLGGIFNRAEAGSASEPSWLGYVRVADVNEAINLVKAGGGTVAAGPMEVPGGDWIAHCIDPQGAPFAVVTIAADMRSTPGPADEESRFSSETDDWATGIPSSKESSSGEPAQDEPRAEKASAKKKPGKKKPGKKKPAKKAAEIRPATPAAATKKAGAKKAGAKKAGAKKAGAKKAGAKKAAAKKAAKKTAKKASKKTSKKKAVGKKAAAKKAGAKKATNKKASAKKPGKKKAAKKTNARRGSKKAPAKKAPAKKAPAKKAPTRKKRGGAAKKKASKTAKRGGRKKAGRK
jgi:predicted enzyme related to lactoylglutathione lyase